MSWSYLTEEYLQIILEEVVSLGLVPELVRFPRSPVGVAHGLDLGCRGVVLDGSYRSTGWLLVWFVG